MELSINDKIKIIQMKKDRVNEQHRAAYKRSSERGTNKQLIPPEKKLINMGICKSGRKKKVLSFNELRALIEKKVKLKMLLDGIFINTNVDNPCINMIKTHFKIKRVPKVYNITESDIETKYKRLTPNTTRGRPSKTKNEIKIDE